MRKTELQVVISLQQRKAALFQSEVKYAMFFVSFCRIDTHIFPRDNK